VKTPTLVDWRRTDQDQECSLSESRQSQSFPSPARFLISVRLHGAVGFAADGQNLCLFASSQLAGRSIAIIDPYPGCSDARSVGF
jgi:hypothetical protein